MKQTITGIINKIQYKKNIKTIQSLIDLCYEYDELSWDDAYFLYKELEEKEKIFERDEDQLDMLDVT